MMYQILTMKVYPQRRQNVKSCVVHGCPRNNLSQIYAVGILSLHYLQQKRDRKRLQACRRYIRNATSDPMYTGIKAIGQSIIDRWAIIAINNEANIIKTKAGIDRYCVVVIDSEVEYVELIPCFRF